MGGIDCSEGDTAQEWLLVCIDAVCCIDVGSGVCCIDDDVGGSGGVCCIDDDVGVGGSGDMIVCDGNGDMIVCGALHRCA